MHNKPWLRSPRIYARISSFKSRRRDVVLLRDEAKCFTSYHLMSCLLRRSIQSDHNLLSREDLERVRKLPLLRDNVGRKGAERLSYVDDGVAWLHGVGTLRHCKACQQLVLAAQWSRP